jgi:hypothetical protein
VLRPYRKKEDWRKKDFCPGQSLRPSKIYSLRSNTVENLSSDDEIKIEVDTRVLSILSKTTARGIAAFSKCRG